MDVQQQPAGRAPWRVAGALVLAFIACFVAALVINGPPTVHPGQEGIEHSYVEGDLGRVMTGGVVVLLALLFLLPAMVFLSQAVGRRTEAGRWAAETSRALAAVYVAVLVGSALAPGAAALWADHHGLGLDTVLAVNNIRNFAYYIALPVMGAYALCVGLAALSDRVLSPWVSWGGVVVGVALLLAIPAAALGIQYGMPLWLLWWCGVGVWLLRHDPAGATARGPAGVVPASDRVAAPTAPSLRETHAR